MSSKEVHVDRQSCRIEIFKTIYSAPKSQYKHVFLCIKKVQRVTLFLLPLTLIFLRKCCEIEIDIQQQAVEM